MSCEVAALSFQANANYGTWSIEFENLLSQPNNNIQFIVQRRHLMVDLYMTV